MSKNQVLIQFFLSHTADPSNTLMFWSCVLDTDVEVNTKILEDNIRDSNLGNDISIKTKFFIFTGDISPDYQKRNPVFLSIHNNYNNGSPYESACAILENYYDANFSKKYVLFLAKIEELTKKTFSDYSKLQIQKKAISAIKEKIGLDVIEHESIPGSIAVYKQLPKFNLDYNYNTLKGKRFIKYSFDKENKCSYLIELELLDKKKILYKKIYELEPDQEIILPELNVLENFGKTHFTIFKKDSSNEISTIFEERGIPTRSVSFGMNVEKGNYKIIQNRFINKKNDSIAISHFSNFSIKNKHDSYNIEQNYKKNIYGKEKQYLESFFFTDDLTGRTGFLDWTRKKLQHAKEVYIIDPFFDIEGLNDFNSCTTTYFSLTILTTDPSECPRDNTSKPKNESKELLNSIYHSFSSAQVYYLKRNKLHDRYLIIQNDEDTIYYNLSNSWNGTVNNYSLFVQELELSIALQVKETYSKYLIDDYLQKKALVSPKIKITTSSLPEENIKADYLWVKKINDTIKNELFEEKICNLLTAEFEGCKLFHYEEIFSLLRSKIDYLEDSKKFIHSLIKKILESQKKYFSVENKIQKGISQKDISEINNCIKTVSEKYYYGDISIRDLKVNVQQYIVLKFLFAKYPATVINLLIKEEEEICFIENAGEKISYYMAEPLISLMISGIIDEGYYKTINEWIEFANNSQNLYCKVFIAQWILHNKGKESLKDKLNSLLHLAISTHDYATILAYLYTEQRTISRNSEQDNKKEIEEFINKHFSNEENSLLTFASKAYLFPYEIDFEHFKEFLNKEPKISEKLEVIFLLYALQPAPSKKLLQLLTSNNDSSLMNFIPNNDSNVSIVNVKKFEKYIPYLGEILCKQVQKYPKMLKNIIFKYDIHADYIFELNNYPNDEFDLYILTIILHALRDLKSSGIEIKSEINSIKWYIPHLLNKHQNDFLGLSFKILELYTSFMSNEDKEKLASTLIPGKLRDFIHTKNKPSSSTSSES